VAMLTRSRRADMGVMISASHNAFEDNGLKLFGPDGYKLSDAQEAEIESLMEKGLDDALAPSRLVGRAKRIDDAQARYIEFAKRTLPRNLRLDGIRIVVDCANGAAYKVAPAALWELGAEVISVGVDPDGLNINLECGSTAPELISQKVRELRADIGIALDGDADRVIICDEHGKIIDGDQVLALIASSWAEESRLMGDGVVATIMSNLGLERYLTSIDLTLERTRVADRYVVEHMRKNGHNIGGEESGHIVLSDFSTTGDGLIAALQVLGVMAKVEKPVSELCHLFEPLPQIKQNVRFKKGKPLEAAGVQSAIEAGETKLGESGRLVVRPSGTERLIRVMGEGDDETLVKSVVHDIVEALEDAAAP